MFLGHHRAGLTKCAEILSWVEAEAGGIAECADLSPFVFCSMRLGGVLDDRQAVLTCEFENRVHVQRGDQKDGLE